MAESRKRSASGIKKSSLTKRDIFVDNYRREIDGEWDAGFVLDQHSTSSIQIGFYPNGRPKSRCAKEQALKGTLSLGRELDGDGPINVLLLDDLFDTGASLDAACQVLRGCEKIDHIYVAALTWTRNQ